MGKIPDVSILTFKNFQDFENLESLSAAYTEKYVRVLILTAGWVEEEETQPA